MKEVRPFLYRLFADPAILRLPAPFRPFLAFLIAALRAPKAREIYRKMGGFSPLKEHTEKQAEALERALKERGDYRCFVGTSYARPFIGEMFDAIEDFAPDRIVLLPLYPQFSTTTTASVLREAMKEIEKRKIKAQVDCIEYFFEEPGFIEALAEKTKKAYEEAEKHGKPRLLFSAHGLPEKIVRAGDPYPAQCEKTATALIRRLEKTGLDWSLCYQSRVGPVKWIGPETAAEIQKTARERRPLVVVPIAFVSEHAETMVELGDENRKKAEREGCPCFLVVETPQTHPAFIAGLARLVTKH